MELNTTQKLCDYIAANYPKEIDDTTGPLDAAIWFCCIQEAKNLSGLNLKDLARVIQSGLKSYDDDAVNSVQMWLDGYAQYIANSVEEEEDFMTLEELLEDFYVNGE